MAKKPDIDDATLRTMQELLRQPPKPHDQMKLGKARNKKGSDPKRKTRKSETK